MKLSHKSAGLCASGAIILTTYTALFNHLQPLEILMITLPGSVVAGVLGFQIGDILSRPKGEAGKKGRKKAGKKTTAPHPLRPMTSSETFLDDLDEGTGLSTTEPKLESFEPDASPLEEFEQMPDEEKNR